MAPKRRFFHGGCRGLEPGDALLPASETGVTSVSGLGGAPYRCDRIYLTDTAEEARSYAEIYLPPAAAASLLKGEQITLDGLGGDLYEVEAIGKVVLDGDYTGALSGRSWEAEAARVVRVLERGISVNQSLLDDN